MIEIGGDNGAKVVQGLNVYSNEMTEFGPYDSVVLVIGDRTYRKSSAALRTAWRLDGLWPLLAAFLIIPRPIRDWVYDWIGSRRYRLFGKRDVCWIPDPQLTERFLD